MKSLINFVRLSSAERALLLRCATALALAALIVRVLPSAHLRRVLSETRQPRENRRYSLERIAWAVATAARVVPGATCLPQAIVARRILRREGYPADLRIGVSVQQTGFAAHAWVESEGRILVGTPQSGEEYVSLPAISKP